MDTQQIEQAERHIRNAWVAGVISASITFVYSLIGTYSESFRHKYGLDTWSLLDVALIAGLSYGIFRKNRFCALGLLVYFIFSKFLEAASSGQFSGGLMALLFAYFFFQGTRSTFQLRTHLLETGQIERRENKRGAGYYALITISAVFILVLGSIIVIGALSPEIEVIPGKQLNKKYLNFVRDKGIIDPTEEIQYWYSDGFMDFEEGFYLFTNNKVVLYSNQWEDPLIKVPFSDILDIEFEQDPSFLDDSRITLLLKDTSTVYFPVSSENGGDKRYYERLLELWTSRSGGIDWRHAQE